MTQARSMPVSSVLCTRICSAGLMYDATEAAERAAPHRPPSKGDSMSRAMLAAAALMISATVSSSADAPKPADSPTASPASSAAAPTAATPAPTSAVPPVAPAVVLKSVDAVHALVVPMKGSYMQHQDAFGRLFGQLQTSGIAPAGPAFGRYLNDATKVPEADLQWEVGVPVGPEAKASAPLEVRDIPAGLAATLRYQGPPEGLGQAWQQVGQWVGANGYRPVGPPIMIFDQPSPDDTQIELRLAVEKAQ
jgi:effector-binding domain-containing protein